MPRYWKILVFLFAFCADLSAVQAQFDGVPFYSDRPGQSLTPYFVGRNGLQFQNGIGYKQGYRENDKTNRVMFNQNVIRYGVGSHFEFNTRFGYTREGIFSPDMQDRINGISFWDIGGRFTIREIEGYKPAVGMQVNVNMNHFLNQDFTERDLGSQVILMALQPLGEKWFFLSNVGLTWPGNQQGSEGFYTAQINYQLNRHTKLFIEQFSTIRLGKLFPSLDMGVAWRIQKDLQLDLSGGLLNWPQSPVSFFLNGGVSWKFNFEKPDLYH